MNQITLLDRLKPEYRVNLKRLKHDLPTTHNSIVAELEKTDNYFELPFSIVWDINYFLNLDLKISQLSHLFND